ncbi:hypothetical protein WR25_13287 [Diploscapter pachys]|uniref:Proteasome subunit beta n=1 Tax=Diploscapter pachys TaxID=2018661 RepID=A0A2A2JRF8_9BILA|nr:hypothetical protein WR25_13287 [Diploscapter pachys]
MFDWRWQWVGRNSQGTLKIRKVVGNSSRKNLASETREGGEVEMYSNRRAVAEIRSGAQLQAAPFIITLRFLNFLRDFSNFSYFFRVSVMDTMRKDMREAIPALGFYPHENISTGTTLISMEFDGGVVVGTDSRTSSGSFISSRATNKITPITDNIVVCRSGSAADTQAIADIVKYHNEAHAVVENKPLTVYRITQIFRRFLYEYRDSLSASVLVAGWDKENGGQVKMNFSKHFEPKIAK